MSQFKRAYELTIGRPYNVKFTPVPLSSDVLKPTIEEFYKDAGTNGYKFTKHQITFNIKKGSTTNTNHSTLTIYNLDDKTANFFIQNRDNHLAVRFDVGYVGDLKTIFKGTIDKVTDDKTGQTRTTKLVLGEATVNKQEAVTHRTYPRGTDINLMVKDLIKDLGVTVGNVQPIIDDVDYPLKKTLHGSTISLLGKIADWTNYKFSVQNGAAYFVPEYSRFVETVYKLTNSSGLIGNPSPISNNDTVAPNSTTPTLGYKVTCLMNGAIQPETTVYIKSGDIDGAYKVTKIDYKGDFRGADWYCEFECTKVDKVIV